MTVKVRCPNCKAETAGTAIFIINKDVIVRCNVCKSEWT